MKTTKKGREVLRKAIKQWPEGKSAPVTANLVRDLMDDVDELEKRLEAIRNYEPQEVVKDEFAYDRMVENYREAASPRLETG